VCVRVCVRVRARMQYYTR